MENVSAENVRQNMNPQNQNQQGTGELEQGTTEPEIFNKIDMLQCFIRTYWNVQQYMYMFLTSNWLHKSINEASSSTLKSKSFGVYHVQSN